MNSSERPRSLTPELIRQLLNHQARADLSSEYVRLMEIYCVVKAGGSAAQIAVTQRLEATECAALAAEIQALSTQPDKTGRIQVLQQEIQEVERSVAHRLAYLRKIQPQEEANVRSCLPLIEHYFATLGQRHD
jgi:hypothetical protein